VNAIRYKNVYLMRNMCFFLTIYNYKLCLQCKKMISYKSYLQGRVMILSENISMELENDMKRNTSSRQGLFEKLSQLNELTAMVRAMM